MAMPVILKGDSSSIIRLAVAEGDYRGCILEVSFFGVKRQFNNIQGGATISLEWTAAETAMFPLGTWSLSMKVKRGETVKTLPFAKVKVTDAPGEVYDAAIKIAPSLLELPALNSDNTMSDVKSTVNAIVNALRGGVACFLAAMLLSSNAAELTPDTQMDNVHGTTTISELVEAAGVSVGGGTDGEAVTNIAANIVKRDVPKMIDGKRDKDDLTYNGDTLALSSGVDAISKSLDVVDAKADEAKARADSVATLVYGDDCQLIATNYNSSTKIPSLMVRFKLKDEATGTNLWYTVYDELRWWNWLTKDYLPDNYYTKAYLDALFEEKADRAWGFYDSHSGNFAPDGYTWISSPKIAIAAGMAYQRILTTSGAVWVLESNGLITEVGGESDTGFFRISDDKGKALFEITKGDEQIAPANAGGCTTRTEMGITHLDIPYFVESSEHPKIQVSRDLKTWYEEGDSACPANVAWSGQSGAFTADVWGKQAEPRLFVQATYKKGAEDKIVNSAPVEFTKLIIGGITYTVAAEEINGKKVLVLK